MLARPQAPKGAGPRQTWARPRQYGQLCAEQVEVRYGRTQPPGARCSAQASQRREEGRRALPGSPRTRERRGHTRQQPAAAARLVKWRSHRRFELKRGKSLWVWNVEKNFLQEIGERLSSILLELVGADVGCKSTFLDLLCFLGVCAGAAAASERRGRATMYADSSPRARARAAHLSHSWPTQAMRVDSSRDPRVDSFAYNSRQPHNSRPGSELTRLGSHRGRCVCLALPLPGRV